MAFMALALPYIAAAGAAASAAGAMASARNQSAMDSYNARVQTADATNAMSAADATASQQSAMTQRQQGQIAASYGAAGVNTSGTPLAVMSDQAAQGELARQLTLYKGRMQGSLDTQQSAISKAQGGAAMTTGALGATGSLLTGAGRLTAQLYPQSGGAGTPLTAGS